MTLSDLLAGGQLEEIKPGENRIPHLLRSARISLKDAEVQSVSANSRFRFACNAILRAAIAALRAHGYRPATDEDNDKVWIHSLSKTIGIDGARIEVLDDLLGKQDRSIYEGTALDEEAVRACCDEAARLIAEVEAWVWRNRPELAA